MLRPRRDRFTRGASEFAPARCLFQAIAAPSGQSTGMVLAKRKRPGAATPGASGKSILSDRWPEGGRRTGPEDAALHVLGRRGYLKKLFGKKQGIEDHLTYSIQFLQLADEQITGPMPAAEIPPRLLSYITEFDDGLKHAEFNSPKFAYRLLFHKKLVNTAGQADRVIEFLDPKSDAAKAINKEYWVKKEVERPKFRASDVVTAVQEAGFAKFRVQREHLDMWKAEDAKGEGKGYGVSIAGVWYWYQSWIDRCIELCKLAGDKYKAA